jgi:uncharacterized protein
VGESFFASDSTLSAIVLPFHTYIVKIASRCNLNCTYCFIYNLADTQWRHQPKLMSPEIFRLVCHRIVEHSRTHAKQDISLVLHGGEPLLGGIKHLAPLLEIARSVFAEAGIAVHLGMQSNGTLFSPEIGDLLLRHNVSVGISIDGPPEINDRHRIDHQGRGSSERLALPLQLLASQYRAIFSGFLVVVDLAADPVTVLDYLLQFKPSSIDFLLPYDNWDRRPPGKENFEDTPYGAWLTSAFEHWYQLNSPTRIRYFASIIRLLLGGHTLVESAGLDPINLIVVEADGDIEGLDSLKGTYDRATSLGLNVRQNSFDEAAGHLSIIARQIGAEALCDTCRVCPLLAVCGAGYLPNRYSEANGFLNPSIYCRDLEAVIQHIKGRVARDLDAYRGNAALA